MNWIKAQTPDDAKFVILKMTDDPMLDHSAEWFPTLTKRQSLLTLQGQEWVQGAQFTKNWGTYKQAVQCLFQDIACLEHYLAQHQIQFDYIYIAKQPVGPAIDKSSEHIPLVSALKNSSEYQLVYENKGAVLFLKR